MTPPKKPRVKRTPPLPPTARAKHAWDMPPSAAAGDKTGEPLYAAVGLALSRWAQLENTLASIFACLVSAGDGEPAARAFGSVITFRGRKEMVESAAEAFFFLHPDDDRIHKPLRDLLKETQNFATRRNEIAHGIVHQNMNPVRSRHLEHHILSWGLAAPRADPKYPLGFVLTPTDSTTSKTQLGRGTTILFPIFYVPDYVYSSAEVLTFANHFERLQSWASRFPLVILNHRIKAKEQASQ